MPRRQIMQIMRWPTPLKHVWVNEKVMDDCNQAYAATHSLNQLCLLKQRKTILSRKDLKLALSENHSRYC